MSPSPLHDFCSNADKVNTACIHPTHEQISTMVDQTLLPEDIMLPPSPPELAEASFLGPPIEFTLEEAKLSQTRPHNRRSSTDPSEETISETLTNLQIRPRNRSPFARSHLRSRSSASSLVAPPMTRAHSSPGPDSRGRFITLGRPASPLTYSGRRQSPLRSANEEIFFPSWSGFNIEETISEHAELDTFQERQTPLSTMNDLDSTPTTQPHTFPRPRRRPNSPLYQLSTTASPQGISANTSPLITPQKFNEPYPSYSTTYSFGSSASSMPSTPTSMRSRSPSISSLETIPDSPDAEEEAESIAQLKAAADAEEGGSNSEGDGRRRGFGFGKDKSRKRWSVCGAERRGDLDLETIWED